MLAYHAKPSLKDHYLDAAEFHAWTDRYQQGLYFDPQNLRGCAVGCWSKDPYGGHERLAQEMGVPEDLLRLADQLFEALPEGQFQAWPRRFAAAIPVGADLGGVRSRFLQWLLFDERWGLAAMDRMLRPERAEGSRVLPVLADMKTHFDWEAEGIELSGFLEQSLNEAVAKMIENFKEWHHWDDFAKPETRASRALVKAWEARKPGARNLAEAAWACRAAWAAREDFSTAMCEAYLAMLKRAPVMVVLEEPKKARNVFKPIVKVAKKKAPGKGPSEEKPGRRRV